MMPISESPAPITPAAAKQPIDWLSIGQLVLGGMGLVLSLLAAALIGYFGMVMVFGESGMMIEATAVFGIAWVSLFLAALALPSIVFSFRQLRQENQPARTAQSGQQTSRSLRAATLALFLWPLLMLAGASIAQETSLAWVVLPPLQLLIIAIPTWWLIEIIRNKLPRTSRQRNWGLVNFSVFVTTPLLMVVEIVVFAVLFLFFVLWLMAQPELLAEIEQLAGRIMSAPADPEAMLEIFAPYFSNPWVIAAVLGLTAVLVPMMEELLKPLGVLLLAGRDPSPADGFIAGALCGAGFGLLESLLYMTNPAGESWVELAAGRTGTVLLHTATTALVGWALASAWRKRRYLRLFGIYLLAVAIHGLWNGLAIMTGFRPSLNQNGEGSVLLSGLAAVSPVAIVLLGVALFGVLLWSNLRLRRQSNGAVSADANDINAQIDQV